MSKDAHSVTKMNVSPGGKQPNMHNTIIPHNNPFGYGGQPQSLVFPLNLPDDHPYKSHQGKPKGMQVVLEECGYLGLGRKKLVGDCEKCKWCKAWKPQVTDVTANSEDSEIEEEEEQTDCCMRRIIALQEDFQHQKCLLQIVSKTFDLAFPQSNRQAQVVEEAGDVCHFLPKFHPEMNPIEYFWGWTKRYFRKHSNGNFQKGKALLQEALDACPLVTIQRFFRRVQRYMSVYKLGATGISAEYAVKKYKSHHGVSQKDLDAADEERIAKEVKLQLGVCR